MAGVPLVNPISDHTGAHGTIRDGSQRNLADDTHLVFDGENHADAMLLITALSLHPLIEGDGAAMHRVAGFPRRQPVVVAPAHFVPAVLIVHGQGAQDYRETGMGEARRTDLVVQLERLFNRLEN